MRAYEPTIEELKRKYDTSLKDKALIKLERDRLKVKVKQLEDDLAAATQVYTAHLIGLNFSHVYLISHLHTFTFSKC